MRRREIKLGGTYRLRLTKSVKEYLDDLGVYNIHDDIIVERLNVDGYVACSIAGYDDRLFLNPREIIPLKSLEEIMDEYLKKNP